MIDLLTEAGRQAIIDQFERNHEATLTYQRELEALVAQFREDVRGVDWTRDVVPVQRAALDHLIVAGDYAGAVQRRLLDLDINLEEAGGIGDLDAAFDRIEQARRNSDSDDTNLFILTGQIGDQFRTALSRQFTTPPRTS